MNDVLMQHFIQLISTNTGLHIREQDKEDLCNKIYSRMKVLNLSVAERYYQLLETGKEQSGYFQETKREDEWRELTLLLTTSESYFFRDKGQINLLKNRILPELLAHKKKTHYIKGEAKQSLRIWSAGCSTGEEPYSLAILVKEVIPDWDKWNIFILGTDINSQSIEKAKRGIYDSWSFRMVEPKLQMRYFYQRQSSWEIHKQIRNMVKFRSVNLIKEQFPSSISDIYDMDIILCRNVFIYFEYKAISVVLQKFYNSLNPGGYLITGHAELHGQNLGKLQTKVLPESVVYQRSEDLHSRSAKTPTTTFEYQIAPNRTVPRGTQTIYSSSASTFPSTEENFRDTTFSNVLSEAETFFDNGVYASAIKEAEQVIKQHPNHFGAYYLIAEAFANLGECEKAIHWCQQALKLDSLSVTPYYLLARIAEEQGDIEKAKDIFKKIIYLFPSSIAAYLELGSLYAKEGDPTRASKMRSTAFELLKELPPHIPVEYPGEITAGELILHVKKLLP